MNVIGKWKVGAYIRLSEEDRDKKVESNSIINQREYIEEYINESDELELFDYYIDDGFTGTNLNRPNFERLIKDIELKKINTVVVKDLSRLGRNYIEVGKCLEEYFPKKDIRFISINDNIDSYKRPNTLNSIYVPLKNIINDEYSRDISNKVKTALYARMRNGEYVGAVTPYGYIKDPKDKHHLIPDPETSKIVTEIFEMKYKDIPSMEIVKYLNENKKQTPMVFLRKQVANFSRNIVKNQKGELVNKDGWTSAAVLRIIKNQIYCGDTIQRKNKHVSYKNHKTVRADKSEQIVVKNTHIPLVEREKFIEINRKRKKVRTKGDSNGELYLFTGYLRCADCGKGMSRDICKREFNDNKKRYYFSCGTYRKKYMGECTRHKIFSDDLEEMVLKTIQVQMKLILNLEVEYKRLSKKISQDSEVQKKKQEIIEIEEKIENQEKIRKELYIDYKDKIINKTEYLEFSEDCSKSIEKLYNRKNTLNTEILNDKSKGNNDIQWINKIRKYKNINELDRNIVNDLIERIYVFEGGNIKIKFKFQDEYERLLKIIEKVTKEIN